ncbi:MAG: VCBS repeat-containing protein [Anaerolineae bacterium]|nr:VCBS repeat-containing protein [Anaerolineae bacterium]
MKTPKWLHAFISLIVSISLLLQFIVPIIPPLHAAQIKDTTRSRLRFAVTPPHTSASLLLGPSAPISVSRVQSSYHSGDEITITYIVHNNLPPTGQPNVAPGATYTDTIDALAAFEPATDANTLHEVSLATTLTAAATYIDSSLPPVQSGNTYTWELGDVLPYGRTTLTLTVQTANTAPDFTNLDTGATATADLWDSSVNDSARPAVLTPDSVSASYTEGTVDADPLDKDMLAITAVSTQDPIAAFETVRGFTHDPYEGSLRGTRGTLWGEAGNSTDKSSLLIAMLRSAGIPARYRHGSLDTAEAQTILASMFPAAQGVAGYVPDDVVTADPVNDPALITLIQDHWWVEAYLPGSGWTNLDPSFPDAEPGDIFATPGSNDRIAELPDSLRHKVTLSLEVEQYNTFPVGGTNLTTFRPLTATYATAQIAARSVSIGHFVTTETDGGVYSTVQHTYTPYFAVDGDDFLTAGDEFQDLLTNFPLATVFTTAEWITVETEDVDGQTTTFTREVKDLIGLDLRLNGGNLNIELPADNAAFTSFDDAFALWFLPNQLANPEYAARSRATNFYDVLDSAVTAVNLPDPIETPEETAAMNEAKVEYFLARNEQYALGGLAFVELADPTTQDIEQYLRVKLFYDQPRIIIASSAVQPDDTIQKTMDLRSTEAEAIVYPDQSVDALDSAQWLKATAESYFEGNVIEQLSGELPLTTARLFDEMQAQGIQPVLITPADMDLLAVYLPDSAAYAHAVAALLEGKNVLIPQSPVLVDSEPLLGWWEIDPQTGVVTGVLQNGLHGAFIEYAMLVEIFGFAVTLNEAAGYQKVVADMWSCIARNVVPALQGNPIPTEDCVPTWFSPTPPWVPPLTWFPPNRTSAVAGVQTEPPQRQMGGDTSWRYLPAHQCPIANCGLEQFALPYTDQAAIPLPEMMFGYNDSFGGAIQAGRVLTVTDNGGSGGPTLTLGSNPTSGTVLPGREYWFDVTAVANFDGLVNVWAYVPDGWQVRFDDNLQANVVAKPGTLPGTYTVQIVGQPQDYPDVLVMAEHTITIPDDDSLLLGWEAEPNITVPIGDATLDDVSNQTNDAEAEIPNSAFRLGVVNFSGQSKTLDVTVTGAPAGWVVLDGRQQTSTSFELGPNERSQPGLYVVPPTLPAPGTAFDMIVEVSDGVQSESVSIPWAMPGQAHNYLQLSPETLYLSPGQSADFTLAMSNVGNASGNFPITADTPLTDSSISNLQSPISLSPGASHIQTPTLSIDADAPHGRYPLTFSSPAPASYSQYALGEIFVLTPNAGAIAEAATCDLGETALPAALQSLALAADELEVSCEAGSCSVYAKDQTIAALGSVAHYAEVASPLITVVPDLEAIGADLTAHTDPADVLADLDNLAAVANQLGLELCAIEAHLPDARFSPYLDAVLLGDTATLTLTVQNLGNLATTYAVTVTTPTGDQTFSPSLDPGDTAVLPINTSPAALGSYDLIANVVAEDSILATDTAVARLNVVDKFVQVTAVAANPPFVETGTSSTDLSVTVANVAGIRQDLTAHTQILAPGGSIQWSDDIPVTLLIGNPRAYDLATVNTSGWAAGVYTLTVDLAVADGSGVGYLGVGQGLGVSHSVSPLIVPIGDITVTTTITTELLGETILPPTSTQTLYDWPERPVIGNRLTVIGEEEPVSGEQSLLGRQFAFGVIDNTEPIPDSRLPITDNQDNIQPIADHRSPITVNHSPQTTWAITRTENSDAAVTYTGSWTAVTNSTADFASNGDYHYSQTTGDFASFNFSGTWIGVGFASSTASGYAEVFVDGASQGLVDLYSRSTDVKRVTIDGLSDTSHVITVTVTGIQNPFSSNDRVNIDYFDTWDGTTMPDGAYEQDHVRVWLSDGWANQNDANASGGSYYRSGHTAWFPFTSDGVSDSITFQAMTYGNSEKVAIYLDDTFQRYLNLQDFTVHTETLTFDGLPAGPHVLTVRAYRGQATIDLFTVPATEPATPPPTIGSFHRHEENDLSILYNGFSFPQTDTTWSSDLNDVVSDHYMVDSGTAGDTISFTFSGVSVGVGFYASTQSGYAEILIDGVSQGIVDTYRREPTILPVYFHNLPNTSHTLTINVLGQKNPFASNDVVHLDYIDVWDGTSLPDGTFEEVDARLHRSYRWSLENNTQASGGQFLEDAITGYANAWFPFTGDSVTFRTIANNQGSQWTKVSLDGQPLAEINLYNNTAVSRTYSFNNLGPGLHVLQLERYHGELMIDAFTTPGNPPFYQTPVYTGVVRYEEDDPMLVYNGTAAYNQRPQTWDEEYQWDSSSGYSVLSTTANDTVSLTFDGRWASVGFFTNQYGGQAEIFVDGVSYGTVGTYSAAADVKSFPVTGLLTGTHTISVTVLGIPDPPSTQSRIYLDYIDVWDGQPMPDEISNASQVEMNGRIHISDLLNTVSHPNGINSDYVVNGAGNYPGNVWYAFTGDSLTFYGFSASFGTNLVDLYVDGQFVQAIDQFYPFSQQPIAHHFRGFGEGAHVAHISNNIGIRVDAFASNQPPIAYQPLAEWWESDRTGGASWWGGVHSSLATGDVDGDGSVEIALTASHLGPNGELFLLRGDGQDAGNGDPIIWSVAYNIFNGFEHVGGVALADLDGQPGAEIVTANTLGVYAYHHDGTPYWSTNAVASNRFYGTPSVGNLDLDTEPEIVINLNTNLVVFEPDGAIAWQTADTDSWGIPVLADLTGDGLLDILVHDYDDTLYLYDYNLGNPQLVWTAVFTNPLHAYGAPAVADLDGDGLPEAVMASETLLFAFNGADGSVQWTAPLDPGRTGGVNIADIDGDGAVEIIASSLFNGGTLYAFEADGTLIWTALAPDSSPLNTSAADLDGDGAFEILWNGDGQGFTIYDGRTGAILFNEPLAYSATGTDIPVAADVDGDGYAEVIVPAFGGIRVFGFDGVWGPARPLWNQLNYHITNIEDDLTAPFSEVNSWDTHNTYRAQTELVHPLPNYSVNLTHTAAITGVTVLPGSFNVPPTSSADPVYGWEYSQNWTTPAVTRTFQSLVTGLQPGEVRQVAEGTQVAYTLSGGSNYLTLPPLYVTAARLAALEPPLHTRPAGGTAVYELSLTNLTATPDNYTITVSGPLADWTTAPATVPIPANSMIVVPLTVTIPATAVPDTLPLLVNVDNGSGDEDVAAELTITDGVDVSINPASQTAAVGETAVYTLTIANLETTDQNYTVAPSGLADVTLPGNFFVPAGQVADFAFTASATAAGPQPFTLLVIAVSSGATDSADAVLDVAAGSGVALALTPDPAVAGPGSTAVLTLTVTNTGNQPDSFDLDVDAPASWSVELLMNGQPVNSVTLPPHIYNSQELTLLVTPNVAASPGDYPVTATAVSQSDPAITASTSGIVQVINRGVQISILSGPTTVDPRDTAVWQVRVSNTGQLADTFDLQVAGLFALVGAFSTNAVTLSPGQSETVQFTADNMEHILPGVYDLVVAAQSQANGNIISQDETAVTLLAYEGVIATFIPLSQTVTGTLTAAFMLVVTNTGNVNTLYEFSSSVPGASSSVSQDAIQLPAHNTAAILVTVTAPGGGTYEVTGTAVSANNTTASATATLIIPGGPPPPPDNLVLYLPIVVKP